MALPRESGGLSLSRPPDCRTLAIFRFWKGWGSRFRGNAGEGGRHSPEWVAVGKICLLTLPLTGPYRTVKRSTPSETQA